MVSFLTTSSTLPRKPISASRTDSGGCWPRRNLQRGTDQRVTRPGRALIAEHRAALNAAESLGNAHHTLWMEGKPTPVSPIFNRLAELWRAVPDEGTLTVRWPMSAVD